MRFDVADPFGIDAKALVNARKPAETRNNMLNMPPRFAPENKDWKQSHSLKKPLKGGKAEMAIEPIKKKKAVFLPAQPAQLI